MALGWTQEKLREFNEKCDSGDSEACYWLGFEYGNSLLSNIKDYPKAISYYERVCKKGNEKDKYFADACIGLGIIYEKELPRAKRDYKKAMKLYTLGCEGGAEIGCHRVLELYKRSRLSEKIMRWQKQLGSMLLARSI